MLVFYREFNACPLFVSVCIWYSKDCFSVVSGGIEVADAVTSQRFDYIFFTGGGSIGKKVMVKAAENLTPITLELGGKRYVLAHTCIQNCNIPLILHNNTVDLNACILLK